MIDRIEAEFGRLHRKVDGLLLAIHHIISRDPHMAASHADVLAALTSNDDALVGLAGHVTSLVKTSTDATASAGAAYDDILARVSTQGTAIGQLDSAVKSALPAPAAAPAPVVTEPVAPAAPAAPAVAEPAAPAAVVPPVAPQVTLVVPAQ